MAEYTVRDEETGKTITFNWQGDTTPTDTDMEEVFKDARNFVSEKNKTSILDDTKNKFIGGLEGILQTATGALATPVAGLAGLVRSAGGINPEQGAQTVEDVQNALTYKPQFQPGYARQFTNTVTKPLQWLEGAGAYIGDKVYDWTGQPELAAGAKAATMLATPGAVTKGAGMVKGGIQSLAGRAAPALYESSLKIPPSVDTAIRERTVQTGLEEGIPVSKGGLKKNRGNIEVLNKQIADVIDDGTRSGQTISTEAVVSRLDQLSDFYRDYPRARKYLNEIDEIKTEILEDNPAEIPIAQAQRMKQKIYQIQRKHYGEMKGVDIEADKAMARGLKEEIVELRPELKNLNARDSAMIELDDFLSRAVNRIGNYETIRIADVGMSVAGGAKIGFLNHYINNPWFKSKLGIILNKAAKRGTPMQAPVGMPPTNRKENEGSLYR